MNRGLLFFSVCLPVRLFLVYLAYYKIYIDYLKLFCLSIGIGFLFIYFGGYRKTGLEATGGKIWWNNYRLIHGINYISFSLLNSESSYLILLFDVLIGFFAKLITI